MTAGRFTAPNWAQQLIADAIGLQGRSIAVRMEDDTRIIILDHKDHKEHIVEKRDGRVMIK